MRDAGVVTLGKFLYTNCLGYVDSALIGYLDVRCLVSRILGAWRLCGMMDDVSFVQGLAQVLEIIHHLHVSTASPSKGWGV